MSATRSPAVSAHRLVSVAIDATPLIGHRTGIGRFTDELIRGIGADEAIHLQTFAMTARHYKAVAPQQRSVLPARPMRRVWEHLDLPPLEWWSGPVDVIHGTNYIVPPTRRATRLVSVHDLSAVHFPHLCTPDVVRLPILVRRAIRSGAHVHTDSVFVADEVMEVFGIERERIHVVPLGVTPMGTGSADIDSAGRNGSRLYSEARPYGGRPYILAIGTVEPRKNYPLLVRAFRSIANERKDIQLVIAGADGWGAESLAVELDSLPESVRSRVHREKSVDEQQRETLLAHCEVMAYPSVYEGFGLPPLEAMAAGRPVVCSNAGSLPEIVGPGAMVVPVGDVDALSSALRDVLADAKVAADLVRRGRDWVARYQWSTTVSEFVALYRSLGDLSPDGVRARS